MSLNRKVRYRDAGLALTILVGMTCVVGMSHWIDSHRPPPNSILEEEKLYLTSNTVKRMSLGFNGIVADWYWMRALQYVGQKVIDFQQDIQLDDLGPLNLKLLAPLLDAATTLDPQFMTAYEYAALVLPAVDEQEAIRITKKGIAANPSAWRLYQHLGYIYWQQQDFKAASEIYSQGATLPGVPTWMEAMKARVDVEGGSRGTARAIYERMYQESDDPNVREMARKRLFQIQSLVERDEIRRLLADYASRAKRCASSWSDISAELRKAHLRLDASSFPLDPTNTPYRLVKDGCDVDLDSTSHIPRR